MPNTSSKHNGSKYGTVFQAAKKPTAFEILSGYFEIVPCFQRNCFFFKWPVYIEPLCVNNILKFLFQVVFCNDHPALTSQILKISFKGLDYDDFGHIPLMASVSLKKTCQLNQRGLERHSARPRPTERRRKKSELTKCKHAEK